MQLLIIVLYDTRAVLYCTHYSELNYVNTNWYGVVLERTCQDVCSAEQLNRILGFCAVSYGGLFGYETVSTGSFDACLCCEILIHSVLLYPNLYSALAAAYSSAAAPSLLHALLLHCRQLGNSSRRVFY